MRLPQDEEEEGKEDESKKEDDEKEEEDKEEDEELIVPPPQQDTLPEEELKRMSRSKATIATPTHLTKYPYPIPTGAALTSSTPSSQKIVEFRRRR